MILSWSRPPALPAEFVVTYDGKEIFRQAIDPDVRNYAVTLPRHSGKLCLYVLEAGEKKTQMLAYKVRFYTEEQCRELIAEAKARSANKRRMKANVIHITAIFASNEYHTGTAVHAEAVEAYGDWFAAMPKPRHPGSYRYHARLNYEKAAVLWEALAEHDRAAQARAKAAKLPV